MTHRATPYSPQDQKFTNVEAQVFIAVLAELPNPTSSPGERSRKRHPTPAVAKKAPDSRRQLKGQLTIAAQRALPHAIEAAGRWRLMENASSAFLDAVRKSMRQIRTAMGESR